MNTAIVIKTIRDSMTALVLVMLGITLFGALFVWAMHSFGQEVLDFIGRLPFLTRIFQISFGIDTGGDVSINVLLAVGFTHAVVLALAWGILIAILTRVIVGEIERGTADLLLTLPLRRPTVYCSLTLAVVLMAVPISFCPLIGVAVGSQLIRFDEPIVLSKFLPVTLNFLAINLAIAGLSAMVSTALNRRGPAVGIIVGVVVVSATLNFLDPFLPAIRHVRWIGLLHYYRPPDIVRLGTFPTSQVAALLAIAMLSWLVGLVVYSRKDIPAA
jgi:ABC-2 type transport system permease protein